MAAACFIADGRTSGRTDTRIYTLFSRRQQSSFFSHPFLMRPNSQSRPVKSTPALTT